MSRSISCGFDLLLVRPICATIGDMSRLGVHYVLEERKEHVPLVSHLGVGAAQVGGQCLNNHGHISLNEGFHIYIHE